MGGTFEHFQPDCGLSFSEPLHAVREQQKQGFWPKSGFGAQLPMKIDIHPKNLPIYVTLCVDSESVIRNMMASCSESALLVLRIYCWGLIKLIVLLIRTSRDTSSSNRLPREMVDLPF